MDSEAAFGLIAQAVNAGRVATGYLVTGDVRGVGIPFAERVLGLLFDQHVEDHLNADIHWLYPEKKSRIISVQSIRDNMVDPLSKTSFLGGWKAGIIVGADRLNPESANAFLKTLEEPPPKTIFLLLTDRPDALLPTIVSRCQRINLESGAGESLLPAEDRQRILDVLASARLSGRADVAAAAMRLAKILEDFKDEAETLVMDEIKRAQDGVELADDTINALISARYREKRERVLALILNWFRDLMALTVAGEEAPLLLEDYRGILCKRAANLDNTKAFRNINAVTELAQTLERNVPEAAALSFWADRTFFGTV